MVVIGKIFKFVENISTWQHLKLFDHTRSIDRSFFWRGTTKNWLQYQIIFQVWQVRGWQRDRLLCLQREPPLRAPLLLHDLLVPGHRHGHRILQGFQVTFRTMLLFWCKSWCSTMQCITQGGLKFVFCSYRSPTGLFTAIRGSRKQDSHVYLRVLSPSRPCQALTTFANKTKQFGF